MAMAVMKHGWPNLPPPVGTGRKGKSSKKDDLKRVTKQSVVEQIRALPKPSDSVVNLSAAKAAIEKARVVKGKQEEDDDLVPFAPDEVAKASSGDTPPPSKGTEWYPEWQFNSNEPAWFNLIRNAYIMKPLGRKFTPDPAYNGKGECPLPQRTSLHCEIRWDNVVPFEDALDEARREAFRKRDSSMRSRGGDALTPVTRDYPGYESSGQPKILGPPAPSAAIQQVPAANQETHLSSDEMGYVDSTSSGDTDDLRDVHLQSLWHFPAKVGMDLYHSGFTALSNDYWAWCSGSEICVGKLVSEMYTVETRMPEMEFYYHLETGTDYLLPQDMVSPSLLTNSAVEAIFDSIPSAVTNEFMTWSATDLDRFHLMVECSRRNNAAVNPMKSSFFNDDATIWDIERWEQEERDGLEALGVSRDTEVDPPLVAANEKPVLRMEMDFSKLAVKLRMTESPELRYHKWLQCNQEGRVVERQSNVLPHYIGALNRTVGETGSIKQLHRRLAKAILDDAGVTTSTPWVTDKPLPPPYVPAGKIRRKVTNLFNRAAHWLNKPVLTIAGKEEEGKTAPAPVDDERIIAASKAVAEKIMFESLVQVDNRESIEWLQNPGRPIEEASAPEFVGKVMHAIQDEEQKLLYTPTGIIIGSKTRLEQVNEGGHILLLNAQAPPKTA